MTKKMDVPGFGELVIQLVDPRSLKPDPRNPRKISEKSKKNLRRSLLEDGWLAPLLARKSDRLIIGGHQKLAIAIELLEAGDARFSTVPVHFRDVDDARSLAMNIRLNNPDAQGEWDYKLLTEGLSWLDGNGFDATMTAFDDKQLESFLTWTPSAQKEEDPDVDLTPPKKAKTKKGEIIKLGPHRLMCGDFRLAKDVEKLMAAKEAALVVTSPPYASQRKYDPHSGFEPIPPDDFLEWYRPIAKHIQERLSMNGSYFLNIKEAADKGEKLSYVKRLLLAHIDNWEWKWIEEYCWPRPALPLNPNTSRRFKNGWESVYHFALSKDYKFFPDAVRHESDGTFKYGEQKAAGKMIGGTAQGVGGGIMSPVGARAGLAYPSNVLDFAKSGAKVVGHSAAFPVSLPRFFINAFSDVDDIVLDPFMGSGSTLMAAEQAGRICFGMEISPNYCDVIVHRYNEFRKLKR